MQDMADLFMKDPVSVSAIIPWNPIVYVRLLLTRAAFLQLFEPQRGGALFTQENFDVVCNLFL